MQILRVCCRAARPRSAVGADPTAGPLFAHETIVCFSATASFALSAVLGGVGAVSLLQNRNKEHQMVAAIPLLFSIQPAAEGIVWMTMSNPAQATLHRLATNAFLIVALMIWPLWMPLALRRAEGDSERRPLLTGLAGVGLFVAVFAGQELLRFPPTARIVGHSLTYGYGPGGLQYFAYLAVYIVPAALPFFVASLRHARIAGLVLISSLILSDIVQRDAITSVWCFFAAVFSGLIVWMGFQESRAPRPALARIVDFPRA